MKREAAIKFCSLFLFFNHLFVAIVALNDFTHEIVGFDASEITVFAHRVGEVFFVTFQENVFLYVIIPYVFVCPIFLSQRHSIQYVAIA